MKQKIYTMVFFFSNDDSVLYYKKSVIFYSFNLTFFNMLFVFYLLPKSFIEYSNKLRDPLTLVGTILHQSKSHFKKRWNHFTLNAKHLQQLLEAFYSRCKTLSTTIETRVHSIEYHFNNSCDSIASNKVQNQQILNMNNSFLQPFAKIVVRDNKTLKLCF